MTTTTFTLDTSGFVDVIALGIFKLPGRLHAQTTVQWSDLSPFTQGYIVAMFAGLDEPGAIASDSAYALDGLVRVAFADLAPETLARIIADCEAAASILGRPTDADDGAWFWNGGQRQPGFPPLTVQLGDDGKVRFAA